MHRCRNNFKVLCSQNSCVGCNLNKNTSLENYVKHNTSLPVKPLTRICPYCLYSGERGTFNYLTKSGNNISKRFRCPECMNVMIDSTLDYVITCDYRKLAEWIIQYPYWEFFKRVDFTKFSKRLYDLGISKSFWDYYKLIKEMSRIDQIKT